MNEQPHAGSRTRGSGSSRSRRRRIRRDRLLSVVEEQQGTPEELPDEDDYSDEYYAEGWAEDFVIRDQ